MNRPRLFGLRLGREAAGSGPPIIEPALLRIAAVFVLIFAAFELALIAASNTRALFEVRLLTTEVADAVIRATGLATTVTGTQIALSSRVLQIDPDCTALLLVAAYSALILAYPIAMRLKAVGLLAGLPVLLVANIGRIVGVAHASELVTDDATFAFVHDYLFKVFMVAVIIALWAWWLTYARQRSRR